MATHDRLVIARHWNARDAGCGELIVGVKRELSQIGPGELLELTTGSPGAPTDVPAWCGMTGHALVFASHPIYVIERRVPGLPHRN